MKSNYANRDGEAPVDEKRLVRQAKAGNVEAFVQLYDAHVERVYRYVYFRVLDDMAAERILSRVFISAWQDLGRYQPFASHFIVWLCTIARSQIIEYYQTHPKSTLPEMGFTFDADGQGMFEDVRDIFDMKAMRDALQFLTEEQQQVLILKFIAGMPTDSIARMMAKSEGTVRGLEMRGLQTLSKYMENKELI